jgi:hypothetical protein
MVALKHMEESDLKELGIPMVRPIDFNLRFSIHPLRRWVDWESGRYFYKYLCLNALNILRYPDFEPEIYWTRIGNHFLDI